MEQVTKCGLGIRPELFNDVSELRPKLGFIEAHSENYFLASPARERLRHLREEYPLSLHGVGLSLGRADALDQAHLLQLKSLCDEMEPFIVSEHLAWSAYAHRHVPDLLPLPLNEDALDVFCQHIDQMQTALQRRILIENPSNYLLFEQLQIPEAEFLNALATRTGCGLLLDINNIFVSAHNLQRDAGAFLRAVDSEHIEEYHLAGHTPLQVNGEDLLIDTHNQTTTEGVWQLYRDALTVHGHRPTLIEWDSDFPAFSVLLNECEKANQIAQGSAAKPAHKRSERSSTVSASKACNASDNTANTADHEALGAQQTQLLDDILSLAPSTTVSSTEHQTRVWIYQNNTFGAVGDYLREVYPATRGVVGDAYFKQLTQQHIQARPPQGGDLNVYGADFRQTIVADEALDGLAYLIDLVDYEWALHKAWFADLSHTLDTSALSQEQLLHLRCRLNDGVSLISSNFPILEIHRQSLPDYGGEVSIDLQLSQDNILVYKHGNQVQTRLLDQTEMLFLQNLQFNEPLGQVLEQLSHSVDAAEISTVLALTFELGLLADAPH